MGRIFSFAIFILACLVMIHRQKFTRKAQKFYPAEKPSNINEKSIADPFNYYRTGKYDISLAPIPKATYQNPLGLIKRLSRKKINGFMFTQYNLYKLEINFVDLGYSSLVQVNYWTQDVGSVKIEEKVGFNLEEDFNKASLNLDIRKQDFVLKVRQFLRESRDGNTQTVTTFNLSVIQENTEIFANYTHIRRDEQCVTVVRNGVISHKCYGGYGYGKVRVNQIVFDKQNNQNKKKMSSFNPRTNQTRCSFDGFRGNGWDWQWTWIYGTGFSKPQFYAKGHTIQKQRWIGLNLGSLFNKSQDFLFLNGKIYPMQGVRYVLDNKFPQGKNISVTVQNPQINMNFQVKNRSEFYEDMGLLKNHMIKAEGHWAGYVIDPENSTNKIVFYQVAGLMESVNSLF